MKILHIAKFNDNKANGIRTVLPHHVIEQAKYEEVLFQNVLPYQIVNFKYQVQFDKNNWPFNIKDLEGKAFKPDLVVFHGFYHFEMIVLSKRLKKEGIPYIIVPHGSLKKKAQQTKRLKKIIGNIVFFNKFLKNAKAVQVLSENEYKESKIKNKKFIGTNGIHIPSKSKSEFSSDGINFIYIGRIDIFIKGLDLLFDAIIKQKELLRKNNCKFFIYGPQTKDAYLLQNIIKKAALEDVIFLHSEIYEGEKVQVLLNADIFIQTSRTEAMPMGILEALSYGLPCLITKDTTLGEMVAEYNAGWVAETTVNSVMAKIQTAIQEKPLLKEKSKRARLLIKEKFSWEKIAQETIKKYKEFV